DDDPFALLILLRIAHLKHADLPATLTFQQLIHLAVVTDKYNAVGTVKPFLDAHLAPYTDYSTFLLPGHEEWLFVAWTFGLNDHFTTLVKHLIRHCRTDEDNKLVNGEGDVLD
ncbi:hypothetical protein K432DRAFT_268349, partial [Lepidopterella palustris CBS 459.81]